MTINRIIVLGTLTFAAGAALAQGSFQHTPAGEGVSPSYMEQSSVSGTTRAAVRNDVLQARLAGELTPAGVGSPAYATYSRSVAPATRLSRSEVKAEVLQARANGTLVPAGQAVFAGAAPAVRTVASSPLFAANTRK